MTISNDQTKSLLSYVAGTRSDDIDCDRCFDHMAEFVEAELAGVAVPEALRKVERHLSQCACCADEHNALLEGLRALEE